jgi:hypothetical protein
MLHKIGNVVVIGLAAREDRWKRCLQIFEENNITKVTHYTTVQDFKDTHYHATKDFLNLLRIKKSDYLVFFEDDFELTEGWQDVFEKAWKDVPKDFDLLYLGANLTKTPQRITENLVKIRGAWCLHGVIFSRKFIDYIFKAYEIDRRVVFDEWCRTIACDRKFYMVYPMICYQRKDFSDYVGRYVDYDLFNNKYYKTL